jgi:predicted ATPase
VSLVDLAAASDAQGVLAAVRSALGQQALATGPAEVTGPAPAVVVLDNCEHVILDAAHTAADLVSTYPHVRVLATSREGLGVPGEVLYPVSPLDHEAAVRLFAERAQAASPGIEFDEASTAAVADICARLDGLPLAIELAAAKVRALDVAQIATRLHGRFQLLTAGPRTLLPRQRTLRAVVDWSYDLLDPSERLLFERLSVFPGSVRLEAVEAVCAGSGIAEADVADLLSRLVDKSLVMMGRGPMGTRYSMLQTLAEYAGERLGEAGGPGALRRRHAEWLLALARRAERGAGSTPSASLAELDAEVDAIDATLTWARAHDLAFGYELASRLGWFWFWTGRLDFGWQTLSAFLQEPVDVPDGIRSRTSAWGGMLGAVMQAGGTAALVDAAVRLSRGCGDPGPLGQALAIRGALAVLQGRPGQAGTDLVEAAACYAGAGDRHGEGVIAMLQGMAAAGDGRLDDAGSLYATSVSRFRAAGDDWAAGVPLQRIAELAEREASVPLTAAEPTRFYQALVRAQLASARPGALPSAPGAGDDQSGDLAVAVADHIRGRVTLRSDHPDQAGPDLELALSRYRAQGHRAAASTCLTDLGRMATATGDPAGAVRFHAQAAAEAAGVSDRSVILAALEGLSVALAATGQGTQAGFVLGAADLLRESGLRPWDPAVDDRAAAEAAAAALLGDDRLVDVRMAGRTMAVGDLLDGLLVAS